MAGSLSDYLEKEILDHIFGGNTAGNVYTPPATLYVGLSTTTIVDAGTGITEPSGNAYARASVANTTANWSAASGTTASKTNATAINFATPTGSWGTATSFFIADALTGGNILAWGDLATPQTIASGNTVSFGSSTLTITLD